MLIDLLYLWGIRWMKLYEEGQSFYGTLLIIFSALMIAGAIGLNIFGYIKFRYCTNWVNIITTLFLIAIPLIQLLNYNQQNSLLTSSAVCLYISYLSLIGQYSSASCEALTKGPMVTDLVISVFLFFVTMYGTVMGGTDDEPKPAVPRMGEYQRPS